MFEHHEGAPARSFPAQMPCFTLDRIYVRDLDVEGVQRQVGAPWSRLSDHVALAGARLTARAVAITSEPPRDCRCRGAADQRADALAGEHFQQQRVLTRARR